MDSEEQKWYLHFGLPRVTNLVEVRTKKKRIRREILSRKGYRQLGRNIMKTVNANRAHGFGNPMGVSMAGTANSVTPVLLESYKLEKRRESPSSRPQRRLRSQPLSLSRPCEVSQSFKPPTSRYILLLHKPVAALSIAAV